MKKLWVAIIIIISMLCIAVSQPRVSADNGVSYSTYTYSVSRNRLVPTQDAYIPLSLISNIAGVTLNDPRDIAIDQNDNVYIADTGNGRVIMFNPENAEESLEIIGADFLVAPRGVHVSHTGELFVTDLAKREVYRFVRHDQTQAFVVETVYSRPTESLLFGDTEVFEPTKVVTDRGGNVFILLSGNINGLAQFNLQGEFMGYFGGNTIPATFQNILRSFLFNEEQRRQWFQMIPRPVHNVAIDQKGLILTTTRSVQGYKKLNIANNIYGSSVFGDTDVVDLTAGPYNNIFTINDEGRIIEYSSEGNVLFVFSGSDQASQKGLFRRPTGIAVDSRNNIYVIDSDTNALQVFVPTHFADLVHVALDLYDRGRYAESEGPWLEVLRMNSLFDLAHKGLGNAYFTLGEYEQAMDAYRIAHDKDGYSNAYWEVRNVSLLQNAQYGVVLLFAYLLIYIVNLKVRFMHLFWAPVKRLHKTLSKRRLYREIMFGFYVIRHPFDAYYGIKRENKTSNMSALIVLMLFFTAYIAWIYLTGFLFNPRIISEINFIEQIITVFVPFVLWVVANYLVCSIRDGEGRISEVFQSSAYALFPMIVAFPVLIVLSNILTYNEGFLYHFLLNFAIAFTILYITLMVKEVHNYGLKSSVINIFISIFTAIMIMLVVFIVYVLLSEIWNLFADIVTEVTSRG